MIIADNCNLHNASNKTTISGYMIGGHQMNKYTERNKALIFVPKCIVNNARTSSFEYKPDCNQRFYFVGAIEHDKHYNDDVNARLRRANPGVFVLWSVRRSQTALCRSARRRFPTVFPGSSRP